MLLKINDIQRNSARTMIYSKLEYGGLDKLSIFHLQGMSKLRFLMVHLRREDTAGQLMDISMRTTQLESGLSSSFFKHDFYEAQCLTTSTWLTNVWQYCCECQIAIKDLNEWKYQPPRKNDFFLMDTILKSDLTDEQKAIFN